MPFPNKKEIERVKKELESIEPVKLLPKDASKADRLKFELCKQFVIYLRANNMSQVELATELGIEPARLNEIIKYRIELFTIDRLLGYVEKLNPDINVTVA